MPVVKSHRSFGGTVQFHEHVSVYTKCPMRFSSFVPKSKTKGCLIWLSGLTCTEENFMAKAGAQRYLAEHGLALVCPDTSPRGLNIRGDSKSSDFGVGAGFYIDAVTPNYCSFYRMYSYIVEELYDIIVADLKLKTGKISIFGHSMGGHGALVIGLRNPKKFKSISALAPITNPMACPWGKKALKGYLGNFPKEWRKYDSCALIQDGKRHPETILVDQGTQDPFLNDQLMPDKLVEACQGTTQKLTLNMREGYDHSYYFVASFIEQHIQFHAECMGLVGPKSKC